MTLHLTLATLAHIIISVPVSPDMFSIILSAMTPTPYNATCCGICNVKWRFQEVNISPQQKNNILNFFF